MKILHVLLTKFSVPPVNYGGTERVLWALYQGQIELGHQVRFLLKANVNNNPNVQVYDKSKSFAEQIDDWADIVHFHFPYFDELSVPFVCTEHSNCYDERVYPINTIFLSQKHANNHHASCYIHNGLYWADYGEPNLTNPKDYYHFLARISWNVKNLKGAVNIAKQAGVKLQVMGGKRFNLRGQHYAYFSSELTFHGMVGGKRKNQLVRDSKGLIFPVLWHEPFGLAITESLYLGSPVFACHFGSLPEIITQENIGYLSNSYDELINAVKQATDSNKYNRRACHEHAKYYFDYLTMSKKYIDCYEKVLAGETLNKQQPYSTGKIDTPIMY